MGFIIAVFIIVVLVAVVFALKRNQSNGTTKEQNESSKDAISICNHDSLSLEFERIPIISSEEENRLSEISDKKMISRIDSIVPGTVQLISGAVEKAANKNSGQLYRVIIPKNTELVKSRRTAGAFRGFVRDENGIKAQAELLPADNTGAGITTAVASVMSVASLIVGQYYMSEINGRLEALTDDIAKVSSFQQNEFRSKIQSLVAEIKKCSDFQAEIMENDDLRKSKLSDISKYEHECIQLLGQANLTIDEYFKKEDTDFKEYEKSISEISEWLHYQYILLDVLNRICGLTYALNLGEVSYGHCYSNYITYSKQSKAVISRLGEWHSKNTERFSLDLDSGKRKRQGFEGVLFKIPALVKEDLKFKEVSDKTVAMISDQSQEINLNHLENENELFEENVELIAKDGKLYYLPPMSKDTEITERPQWTKNG